MGQKREARVHGLDSVDKISSGLEFCRAISARQNDQCRYIILLRWFRVDTALWRPFGTPNYRTGQAVPGLLAAPQDSGHDLQNGIESQQPQFASRRYPFSQKAASAPTALSSWLSPTFSPTHFYPRTCPCNFTKSSSSTPASSTKRRLESPCATTLPAAFTVLTLTKPRNCKSMSPWLETSLAATLLSLKKFNRCLKSCSRLWLNKEI